MFRTIAAIALAIRFGHPDVTEADATRYAEALQIEAQNYDFDPLTGVAIIHRESQFHAGAVSPDKEDFGLAQIRARYIGACKKDKDPRRHPSAACRSEKDRLLNPAENIRVMAELISGHRKLCRQKTGKTELQNWLASYQGSNSAKEGRWCTPSDGSLSVARYRELLMREVARRSKEIESTDRALALRAEQRARLADSRDEGTPASGGEATAGRLGG